ncbi:MAG TPA: nuclear transport factor 2 family protein [Candidatus Angelobacter sp.]|jgi:ketosteroid isomerase-like protein
MDEPIQVVLQFEQFINARNPKTISAAMTADAAFVDSLGNRVEGTAKLQAAWEGYFKMVPDYSISHSEIFADGNTVAVFGSAQGTFVHPKDSGKKSEADSRAELADQSARSLAPADHSVAEWNKATEKKENFWKTPAAWRAVVKDGKIAVWQVFADNEPIRAIMRKNA